jgi:beta-aspartyl-peptidase (threonine type)
MQPIAIAIHGGAGTILRSAMTPEKEARYQQALQDARDTGYAVLLAGGTALDAVEAAVVALEECPLFNAGRGAVFTAAGTHEMDASIMEGAGRQAGAVSLITGVRNPVRLARLVMERSGHVMLAGEGARAFAEAMGVEFKDAAWFHDDFRYDQWQQVKGSETFQLDHSDDKERKFGTVGAVALDQHGHLAAATSTGGMTNKRFGRIGDSPIIGAGTWADDRTCAISCTGSGEYFIRGVVAYDVACLIEHKGLSLHDAAHEVVMQRLHAIGGDGGLIALNRHGDIAMPFNTEGMYRAAKNNLGVDRVEIYGG